MSLTTPSLPTTAVERRKDVLTIAAMWLLLALLLGKALLPGWVLLPLDIVNQTVPPWQPPNQTAVVHNPLLEDAVFYIYPVKAWTAAQVRQGVLPLWSDELFGGYPAIYDTQAGLFYPLSLLYYLLDGATAVDLTIFLQLGLGSTFMFLYLRKLRLRRLAAVLGTAVFLGNGLMVVWLEWQVVHAAIIWLPLALWAIEKLVAHHSAIRNLQSAIVFFALAFALPWLGGHWNWALYSSMTAVLYLLWRVGPLVGRSPRRAWAAWRLMGLPLALGVGLALVQVLPAFRFLLQSHRQPLTWAESQQYGLLNRLAVLVMPDFFGTPLQGNWWGFDNYNETALYVGILPLLLVGAAVWLARRQRVTQFWLVWGGLGLLWALGKPAYGLLYVLPVFNGLLPSRAAVLVVVAAAVLAAIGLNKLLDETAVRSRNGWLPLGVVALLALAAVYFVWYWGQVDWTFWVRPFLLFIAFLAAGALLLWARARGVLAAGWFGALALALVIVDLLVAGVGYNTISPVAEMFPQTATAVFLHNLSPPPRITSLAEGIAYRPNTALAEFVPALSGYGPGISQRLVDYLRAAEGGEVIRFGRVLLPLQAAASPLLDALGVSHIVTTQDVWGDEAEAVGAASVVADWQALGVGWQRPLFVNRAGLFRIDVPLRAAAAAQGDITLRLFTADGGQELAHSTLPVGDVTADGWTAFYFSPFPPEWGQNFLAELSFSGGDGVTVGREADGNWAFAAFVRPRPGLVYESGKTRVYANTGDLGRAFVVGAAQIAESPEAALTAVQDHTAQLDQVVVLELAGQPAPPTNPQPAQPPGTVAITEAGLNRVALQAEMAAPGFVVLADAFYPGWLATVDGQPAPVYRANTVVRAVSVPAGAHEIVFRYRPVEFWAGAAASGLALVGILGLAVMGVMGWRKRP